MNQKIKDRCIGMNDEFYNSIALDFDGVIHSYESGWEGVTRTPDPPTKNVKQSLEIMKESGFNIKIYSNRASKNEKGVQAIRKYMLNHDLPYDRIVKSGKPFAKVLVDDRAVRFPGEWSLFFLNKVLNYKPWHKINI